MKGSVPVAYCTFQFKPDSSLSLIFTHQDQSREEHPVHLPNLREGNFSAHSHVDFVEAVLQGKQQALNILNEPSFGELPIALKCPNEWHIPLLKAFKSSDFEVFDILSEGAAEASCFYKQFESALKPIFSKWLQKCKTDNKLIQRSDISASQLERAFQALLKKRMTVAVVGAMKAGKSTFLNALLGCFVMPAMDKRCTRRRFVLRNSDERGEGRRVDVHLLGSTPERPIRSAALSIDADELGWNSDQFRSYLFALNAPNLIDGQDTAPDQHEQMLLHDFKKLPFRSEAQKQEVYQGLKQQAIKIDTIWLTHPFHNLSQIEVGNLELWDTPGPNAIEEEAEENFDEERILSDRAAFEQAVKDSSALLVIFDVMQQEAQAQDEVLKIVSQRHGEAGSILLIANKVDLRPKRGVLPLDDLLGEIQKQAQERYNMTIRAPIPTSSRPAQLARELMAYDSIEGAPEDLQEEYDAIERGEDRKANKEHPEKAVEARSGILETENRLKRFFRQEPGRAILQDATGKLLSLLEDNHKHDQQILDSQKAELEQFYAAAQALERGYATLKTTQEKALHAFESAYTASIGTMKAELKGIKEQCLSAVESYWKEQFGLNEKLDKSAFESHKSKAYSKTFDSLEKATKLFEQTHQFGIQQTIPRFWETIKAELKLIEKNAARELGIKVEEKSLGDEFQIQQANLSEQPQVSLDSHNQKDGSLYKNMGAGAAAGASIGAAIVGVAALLSGPVGWAALAAAAAGGAAAGVAGGAAGTKSITVQTASKSKTIHAYKEHFSTLFQSWEKENLVRLDKVKTAAKEGIDQRSQETMQQLKVRLDEAQSLAADPNRAEKIQRLRHFLSELERDIEPLRLMASRLGLTRE